MEDKEIMKNGELSDEELENVNGGEGRKTPTSKPCPACGSTNTSKSYTNSVRGPIPLSGFVCLKCNKKFT